jgi:sensor domain CHASE-containing protein
MIESIKHFVEATKSWTDIAHHIAAEWNQPYLTVIESIQHLAYTKYNHNEYAAAVALLRKSEQSQSSNLYG